MIHRSIQIFGRVQGVFFRQTAKEKAERYKVNGFAHNNEDGSVSIEAEGEEENMKSFLDWCSKGPAMAHVSRIVINDGVFKNYNSFKIIRDNTF